VVGSVEHGESKPSALEYIGAPRDAVTEHRALQRLQQRLQGLAAQGLRVPGVLLAGTTQRREALPLGRRGGVPLETCISFSLVRLYVAWDSSSS